MSCTAAAAALADAASPTTTSSTCHIWKGWRVPRWFGSLCRMQRLWKHRRQRVPFDERQRVVEVLREGSAPLAVPGVAVPGAACRDREMGAWEREEENRKALQAGQSDAYRPSFSRSLSHMDPVMRAGVGQRSPMRRSGAGRERHASSCEAPSSAPIAPSSSVALT